MQLPPSSFSLSLCIFARTEIPTPHFLTKPGLTEPAYFRACWKLVVGKLSRPHVGVFPSSRNCAYLLWGGKEGLTTLTPDRSNGSTVSKKLLLLWRSSWDFDRLLVLSACPPPSPPPSPVRRSSFAELRFPRVDPLGIGKLVVTDISSPLGFSYFIPRSFLASFRGSFSSRAVFFFLLLLYLCC